MGQALYRKYRSKSLDEIVGQSHITDMLRRAIKADRIAHAYLLTGPRGVGKTSIARILAHEINQLSYTDESTHLDIIEIDAASNNGVDDIRELRERAMIAPTSARKKIYIIDEVHMLSKPAFNALLKTLEEPPSHVVFILATTDVEKLPATIISRVQRFNFRAIHPEAAVGHLRMIANNEGIAIDDDALALIAHHGRGSFRDSISLLDQLQSLSDDTVTRSLIEQVLGLADEAIIERLLTAHLASDLETIVSTLEASERSGTPALVLTEQLTQHIRSRALTNPRLLTLLDALLDVPKNPWPHVKLLTALAGSPAQHAAATQTISSPAPQVAVKDTTEDAPQPPKTSAVKPPKMKESTPVASSDQREAQSEQMQPAEDSAAPVHSQEFDWEAYLSAVDESAHGAAVILKKCGYQFDGTTLAIYAGKKFAKTNLDKAMPALAGALQVVAGEGKQITILAEPTPPTNSQTATILAMMGGGEEVSL